MSTFSTSIQKEFDGDSLEERAKHVRAQLAQFYGSEQFYHLLALCKEQLILTEGTHFICQNCGGGSAGTAYWLMDLIASCQNESLFQTNDFQVWTLTIQPASETRKAHIACTDGNEKVLATQEIEYTDFLLNEGITLYAIRDRYPDHLRLTVLLPSEY